MVVEKEKVKVDGGNDDKVERKCDKVKIGSWNNLLNGQLVTIFMVGGKVRKLSLPTLMGKFMNLAYLVNCITLWWQSQTLLYHHDYYFKTHTPRDRLILVHDDDDHPLDDLSRWKNRFDQWNCETFSCYHNLHHPIDWSKYHLQ